NTTTNWTDVTGTVTARWQGTTAVFGAQSGTVTLGAPISAQGLTFNTAGYIITSPSFALTLTGNSPTISVNAGTTTIAAPIAGSAGLTVNGTGTLALTNSANSYTGGTTITTATVQIGNGGTTGALGSGNIVDNGQLIFNRSDTTTVANAISGTG